MLDRQTAADAEEAKNFDRAAARAAKHDEFAFDASVDVAAAKNDALPVDSPNKASPASFEQMKAAYHDTQANRNENTTQRLQETHDAVGGSAAGENAWRAVDHQVRGKGIIGSITSLAYDEDKGGMQYGGILGAGLGLLAGLFITGGGGGGILGIIGILALTFFGAQAGKKMSHGDSGLPAAPPVTSKQAPANGPAAQPTSGYQPRQHKNEPSHENLGGFSSPITPVSNPNNGMAVGPK